VVAGQPIRCRLAERSRGLLRQMAGERHALGAAGAIRGQIADQIGLDPR
jgi:hypothetical protein